MYNKLAKESTSFPLTATSIVNGPTYGHPDLPVVSQTQMPATLDREYDEIVSTTNQEHREKQPASPANMTDYYDDVIPKLSYQCTPHPPNHDAPVAYVNVDFLTRNELSGSRTNGEEDKSNNRNLALFDDPSYAALPLISSDNGNNTGQF